MQQTTYSRSAYTDLPHAPGVYQFFNAKEALLYVGKAKDLKKRVSSYFQKDSSHIKTRALVKQVAFIEIILVNSEYEALLLENNLIKAHQPRYNTLLKDDKTFPYLCLTHERFPRLISTRQKEEKKGRFFGPFTNLQVMDQIQELIRQLYPLRTCKYKLSEENVINKKFRVCLEYHIKRCLGPCEGLQSHDNYLKDIEEVTKILKGDFVPVKKEIKEKMLAAAKTLAFEKAQKYKNQLEAIEQYQSHSLIVHPKWKELDVMAWVEEPALFVSYLRVKKGQVIFAQTIEIKKELEEVTDELLIRALYHFREKSQSEAKELLSSQPLPTILPNLTIHKPQVGDKKKLVQLAYKNAFFFQKERLQNRFQQAEKSKKTLLMQLKEDLKLKELPLHIECFDNSNLQGTNPVAAMVCFKKGVPAKKDYRHFHIKGVIGADDCASMQEVIKRRYSSLSRSSQEMPQLILVDGGKGQLNAAKKALQELNLYGKIALIAIAKRLETLYYPEDPYPLHIDKKSTSLLLLQRIRNEAHRFAITFHRTIRMKNSLKSQLEKLPGIGPKTISLLREHFTSLEKISRVPVQELVRLVGEKKAAILQKKLTKIPEIEKKSK